jgi:autotransporter-associated beta strand protein
LSINGSVTLGAGNSWTITSEQTVTFNGVVQGSGGLVKAGSSSLTLSGVNTFTGTTSATAGTLTISNTNALQDATFLPGAGGTVTFVANPRIGGLTGSGAFGISGGGTATLGGASVGVTKNDTFSGSFSSATLPLAMNSASGLSVQAFSGTSIRTSPATTITRGAMRITTTSGLYTASPTGTTTVSSDGGLWVSGSITPNFGPISINGTGAAGSLDGAIRNVSGNNTLTSTVTVASSATVQSDADVLSVGPFTVGSSSTLSLVTTGAAGITLRGAATGTGTSKVLVPVGSTVKAGVGISGALAATLNEIDGTFDVNVVPQTIAAGKTLQVDGTWAGGTTTTTIVGTLDGTGSMTGSGTVSVSTGGALKAGSGAANGTLSIAGPLTFAAGSQSMTLPGGTGTTLSKVAVAGAVTHTGNVTVNATSSTGWTPGTYTFLTYGSKSGAGAFVAGALTGGTGRQSIGNLTSGVTSATFDLVSGNTSVTWAGGDGGDWYDGQAAGWTGTGVTDFVNGDTVTFGSNTTTATLTSDVTVASLTMNTADHTLDGPNTLTNNGALSISGAFVQTLNVAGEHGAISVGVGSTLALNNTNALGSGTGTISMLGSASQLRFDFDANNLSTARPISITAAGAVTARLKTNNPNTFVTLSGAITGGSSTGALTKSGSGTVELTGAAGWSSFTRIGDASVAELPGENVLRVSALPSTNLRLNQGGILEWNGSTFSRTYGTGGTQFYVEDAAGNGAGFAAGQSSGLTVSANIAFGTTNTTQWVGPMYFGTAFGTAQGRVTMTSVNATALCSASEGFQTLHVFGNSSATITNVVNAAASRINFFKEGTGSLFIVNGSTNLGTVQLNEGTLDVGPSSNGFLAAITVASADCVVRQEPSQGSTTISSALAFVADATLDAAGSGVFTIASTIGISSNIITLTGSGTGLRTTTSGTSSTGKYIKTGTGAWELAFAYPNLNVGQSFGGGVEVQEGLLKASKRYALGRGPIVLKGGNLQFSDTTGNTLGSIASLSTAGQTSTPRIILGA